MRWVENNLQQVILVDVLAVKYNINSESRLLNSMNQSKRNDFVVESIFAFVYAFNFYPNHASTVDFLIVAFGLGTNF